MATWIKDEDEGKVIGECPAGHTVRVTEILEDDYIVGSCDKCSYEVDKAVEKTVT